MWRTWENLITWVALRPISMADENWTREYQDGETVPGTPYKVISLVAAGGMGSVYIVEHVELGRRYVLKSLLRTLASRRDLIARMRNEWRALGKLKHPNIVDVINAGATPDGVPFYVMELLSGETVRERLARLGQIPPDQAVRIAQATLVGLAAAHAIGVIHRDVKPANVFLTRDGGVKVLDFGIAQMRVEGGSPKITAQGLAIGTPRYMSPEQASGEKADARSDVYAVGLLLYEMVAGEGPFDDLTDITQQMLAHLHRPPRPLRQWADLPAGLEALIGRALAKHPDERPRSAEYMAAELAPFAGSDPPDHGAKQRHPVSSSAFVQSSFTSTPSPAPTSSPTPAGIVINTSPPLGVKLNPAWHQPTLELSVETRLANSSVAPDPFPTEPVADGATKRRAVGVGLVLTAVVGLAVAVFAVSTPTRSRLGSPGAAAPTAPAERISANTNMAGATTPTPIANAAAPIAVPPPTTSVAIEVKPRTHRPKKRPATSSAPTAPPDEGAIRLPPSGL
jgi:serine/threonine protein kinase